MAFTDSFDVEYTLKHDPERMVSTKVFLSMMTDSLSLFGGLTRSSTTIEKLAMTDLQTEKDACQSFEANGVALIRSKFVIANGHFSEKGNPSLMNAMKSAKISHLVEQWIIRSKIKEVSVKKRGRVLE